MNERKIINERLGELIEETVRTTLLEFSTSYVNIGVYDETKSTGSVTAHLIPVEFCERFAELIVRECMNRVSKWDTFIIENDKIHHSNIADDINEDLRKHFGIE